MADQALFDNIRALDAAGDPVAGAEAYFYESGTSTPLTVYTTSAGSSGSAHPSPLVADANGMFAAVFVEQTCKVDVQDPDTGSSLPGYPKDVVPNALGSGSVAGNISFTPSADNSATDVQGALDNNTTKIAYLEDWRAVGYTFCAVGGTADAITLSTVTGKALTSLEDGATFAFEAGSSNTGATTINVDGIGAKAAVDRTGSALTAAYITSGDYIVCWYDEGNDRFEVFPKFWSVGENIISETVIALSTGVASSLATIGDSAPPMLMVGYSVPGSVAWTTTASAEMLISRDGNLTVDLLTGSSNDIHINFGDPADEDVGQIKYAHSDNTMSFMAGTVRAGYIKGDGDLRWGQDTTSDPALNEASGVGIDFNGQTSIYRSAAVCLKIGRGDDGGVQAFLRAGTTVGTISVSAGATAYNTSSDYRLKSAAEAPADYDPIERVKELAAAQRFYTWNEYPEVGVELGWYAHELQAVAPRAVTGEKDATDEDGNPEYQGRDDSKLIPDLVAAIAALTAKVEALEAAE